MEKFLSNKTLRFYNRVPVLRARGIAATTFKKKAAMNNSSRLKMRSSGFYLPISLLLLLLHYGW